MVYAYCRVSTVTQLKGNSIEDQKVKILNLYPDADIIIEAYSGAKERNKFQAMVEAAVPGDVIVATKLDRFCRTVREGLEYIELLMKKEVRVHILNMGLIENTPVGQLMITCLLAFAEYERTVIIGRTQDGKAIAKQNPDFREGRPKKYGKKQIQHALGLLETHSYKQVTELTGISKSTLIRAKSKFNKEKNLAP